jgi:uncharacterized protein (TIGR02246 family)
MSTPKQAIEKLIATFTEAFNKGDVETIANLYLGDARLFVPDAATIRGRSGIIDYWAGGIAEATDGKLTADEVQPLGPDAALVIGTYSERSRAPSGTIEAGKYVMLWQRVGADWKIALDIWNANPPQ